MGERTFDYSELVDELRCHSTEWLEAARVEAVRERRRWRIRELAIVRVLDERGEVDDSMAGEDGVSVRDVRETRETARLLDERPEIAKAAHDGELSEEQLSAVTRLAEPADDAEWAQRAKHTSPEDLQRLARRKRTPTAEEGQARRRSRRLGFWWREDDGGMLDGRFSLPDVDGALFERVINQMIDKMKPRKGAAVGDPSTSWCRRVGRARAQLRPRRSAVWARSVLRRAHPARGSGRSRRHSVA